VYKIYKCLDIGSNKASLEIRKRIPHHLIDELDFWQEFNVSTFHETCCSAIDDVLRRHRVPIVVGGAGYYLRSLIRGVPTTPIVSDEIETRVRHWLDIDSDWDISLKRLERVDPIYSATLGRNDYYRLQRALCVFETCGKPVSSFMDMNETRYRYDWRCVFLSTDRVALNRVVDRRVEGMIEAGMIEEVADLMINKKFSDKFMAGKAIGYRETIAFLRHLVGLRGQEGPIIPWERVDTLFLDYLTRLMRSSRHYAKRQWTWFRNEPDYVWIETGGDESQIERQILDLFHASQSEYKVMADQLKHLQTSVVSDQRIQRKLMNTYTSILSVYHDIKKRGLLLERIWNTYISRWNLNKEQMAVISS
jgi:tRNA dimethylallyltransferase